MLQTGKSYVQGTSAVKLEPDIYEENVVLKRKKKARSNFKYKIKAVFTIMLIFAACLALVYKYAEITSLSYEAERYNKEYNSIINENKHLMVEIANVSNLERIRDVAENQLGMHKPDRHQIIYVSIPKNDFSVVENTDENEKTNSSVFVILLDKLGKLTNLLS